VRSLAVVRPPARASASGTRRTVSRRQGSRRADSGAFDRAYWLAHCEGYRVEAAGGRLGFVEETRSRGGTTLLAVRAGRLGRRILLVPADEVAFVVPRAKRLWLRTGATIVESEDARP
jgi:hypothetical protein